MSKIGQKLNGSAGSGCPEGAGQMTRFLETCLLLLLTEGDGHGYALLEKLPVFGFQAEELKVSTLYRTLRKMELESLVVSDWEAGGLGPPRRVYALTETGRERLCRRIGMARERRARLERLINVFETRFPDKGQKLCPEKRQKK